MGNYRSVKHTVMDRVWAGLVFHLSQVMAMAKVSIGLMFKLGYG